MSTTLADRQTEREQLKAERAREQYEQALAETCVADDVHGGARLLRDVVARAVADLPERLAAAIEGQTEEAAIHYHLSDCVHDVLREVGEQVAAGTRETMPELGEAVRRGVQPRDLLTVSQWADRHRWLDSGTNIPGQWRTDRVPYLREIMDSLSEHSPVREVTFMKAAGVGGSEVLWNWVGYIMHHLENKDTMLVVPSLELRNRSFNPRLRKVIDETPVLKDKVASASSTSRNRTNRDDLLEFGARARLIKAGANSADSLRSDHLPYVITDEVDGFPWEVGDEGDPLTLIENRQRTFSRAKTYRVSTPTVEQASRIDQAYKRSDRRLYHVPCPHCGHEHPLEWKHFQFRTAAGEEPEPGGVPQVTQAWMFCPSCGGTIEEGHKPAMLAGGRWIAQRPRIRRHRGYHLNVLYAPVGLGLTWREVAEKWVACQNDASELKGFVNTYLGEVWREEGDSIDDLSLITRLEPYGVADVPIVLITAGVDVQADRLELSIYGWGAGEESWALDHIILPGQTAVKGEGAWLDLEPALLDAGVQYACIDSGYHADAAKGFVEERRWCFATNGMPGMQRPVIEDERRRRQRLRYRRKRGAPVEPIGVDNAKSILYARLKMSESGPGYIHFRQAPAFDDEFFAQLGAEKLVKRVKRGRSTVEWVQDRARNEALDCAVLALAAVRLSGQDLDALARAGRYIRAGRRQSASAGSGEKRPPASTPSGDTGFGSEGWTL